MIKKARYLIGFIFMTIAMVTNASAITGTELNWKVFFEEYSSDIGNGYYYHINSAGELGNFKRSPIIHVKCEHKLSFDQIQEIENLLNNIDLLLIKNTKTTFLGNCADNTKYYIDIHFPTYRQGFEFDLSKNCQSDPIPNWLELIYEKISSYESIINSCS